MLKLESSVIPDEYATAVLDFSETRPFVKVLKILMGFSCFVIIFGYLLQILNNYGTAEQGVAALMAVIWLGFNKKIIQKIVSSSIAKRTTDDYKHKFEIDDRHIDWMPGKNLPIQVKFNSLKYVIRNSNGFIIPLTGVKNAAKFIYLSKNAFSDLSDEQALLNIFAKYKIKLKEI